MTNGAGTLVSVNVGLPRDVTWRGRTVHTGVWKRPVEGPRSVRRRNIDGDGQGDLAGHGGEQRAVLVYQLDSYRHWSRELGREDLSRGHFGENFTVDGLADVYSGTMIVVSSMFVVIWFHLARRPDLLHGGAATAEIARRRGRAGLIGPVLYAVMAPLAWLSPVAMLVGYAAVALFYASRPFEGAQNVAETAG